MASPSLATSTQDTAEQLAARRMDVALGVLRLSSSSSSTGGADSRAAAAADVRAQAARLARAATKKLFIFINSPASGEVGQGYPGAGRGAVLAAWLSLQFPQCFQQKQSVVL